MKTTEQIEGWIVETTDYRASPDIDSDYWTCTATAEAFDVTIGSHLDDEIEIDHECRCSYSYGCCGQQLSIPLAVIRKLLNVRGFEVVEIKSPETTQLGII